MEKQTKNERILDMYVRLCEGKCIQKAEEAVRFGVDERSIQRDIDDIRAFLGNQEVGEYAQHRKVIYDRNDKCFRMTGVQDALMSNSEILAVSKILLESRAFTKQEINSILDKLIAGCTPQENMKLVAELVANEKYHYVDLHDKSSIQDRLWELGNEIRECNLLELTYERVLPQKSVVKRTIEPVAVLFSEYYFYLIAYITKKEDEKYVQAYSYPAVFRIDRIQSYRRIGEKFRIAYADRFQEGEFRKRVQFMFPGKLIKLQLRCETSAIDAVLDRLPTAQIVKQEENGVVIEAEVYGKGIMMWLLSQGSAIEILKPAALREEMKEKLQEMLKQYE